MYQLELPERIDLMLNYAFKFIGLSYMWGGDDPINSFDCSGLCIECLKAFGFYPNGDATAQGLYDYLSNNNWLEKKEKGAILFFGKSRSKITHVAFSIDKYGEFMVEAGGGDHTTTSKEIASKQNAFIRIRPIRKDLIAYLYPPEEK
jgi:cell wall-associated NlpC family hydrolase